MSQYGRYTGNFTPAKEFQPFLLYDDLKHLLRLITFQFILREEEHTDTVFALSSKFNAKRLGYLGKEFVADLYQNTNTVTSLAFCIFTGSVLQILYDSEGIFNRFTALRTFDVYNSTNTTVVMFKFCSVKRCFGNIHFCIKHLAFSFSFYVPRVHFSNFKIYAVL